MGYVPEAEAYDRLVEFERRLDATLLRKQLDIQESKQGKTSRVRLQYTRRTHNAPAPHVTRNANLRAFIIIIIIIDDDDRRRRSCACSSTTPTTISRATTTSTRY